jgi:hypothetical protein
MKNYILPLLILLTVLSLISGCATVDVGNNYNNQKITTTDAIPIAHINANNYGYYLFSFYPIWTGQPGNANTSSYFIDEVNVAKVTEMLTKKSKELGATKTVDLQSTVTYTGGWSLWIIYFKEVQVSGNAIK